MGSCQKLDQPPTTIQERRGLEVQTSETIEAREWRLRVWEDNLKKRECRLDELEKIEQEYLKMAGNAAARRAAPEVSWAHEEAVEKTWDAIRSMRAVEKACGHALDNACHLLEASLEEPCAKSAASALMDLAQVAKSCDKGDVATVKAAERAARDVVVLRCCSQGEEKNRDALLEAAEKAFGRPLDRALRAKLLLAFSKIFKNQPDTFLSNAQLATQCRGGRQRPRHSRSSVEGATTKEQLEVKPMYVLDPSADERMHPLEHPDQFEDASADEFFGFLMREPSEELNGTACALPQGVFEGGMSCPRDGSWRESEDAIY